MRVKEIKVDENARIHLILNGQQEEVNGSAKVVLVDHLIWEIDGVPGKRGCLIEVEVPSKNLAVNFVPSHDFCETFLDWMLECEWRNDHFEFQKPTLDKKRPPQLLAKIERIQRILEKWKALQPINPETLEKLESWM